MLPFHFGYMVILRPNFTLSIFLNETALPAALMRSGKIRQTPLQKKKDQEASGDSHAFMLKLPSGTGFFRDLARFLRIRVEILMK